MVSLKKYPMIIIYSIIIIIIIAISIIEWIKDSNSPFGIKLYGNKRLYGISLFISVAITIYLSIETGLYNTNKFKLPTTWKF